MRPLGWALIQLDWSPYNKRKFGHRGDTRGSARRGDHVRTPRKADVGKPEGGASDDPTPADAL